VHLHGDFFGVVGETPVGWHRGFIAAEQDAGARVVRAACGQHHCKTSGK